MSGRDLLSGWLASQIGIVSAVHAWDLPNSGNGPWWVLALMVVQYGVTGLFEKTAGIGYRHPVAWLAALGTPLMLIVPGESWLPIVVVGSVYYLDLAAFVLVWHGRR